VRTAIVRVVVLTPELRRLVAAARTVVRSDREWSMMNAVPEASADPDVPGAPADYVDLLRVVNGGIFGSVVLFGAELVDRMQFSADSVDGAPVVLGRESWFCFGKVGEDPLFLDRRDGSVWGFPDQGITWWQSDVFERLAAGLGEFLVDQVFGPGYPALAGVRDDDQWQRLLVECRARFPKG